MREQVRIREHMGRLIGWLESWRNAEGGYNGFVVHRFEQKRMGRIHDTAWTQAAMIRGFANLARRSQEARWHDAMIAAADLQAARLVPKTARYRYAGHENDRFCSLVHCALANCALLSAWPLVDEPRRQRYLDAAVQNVDRYILPELWVPKEGAFRFSAPDYYSLHEDRFVVNFNMMAVENLLRLAELTGRAEYRQRAERVGQWLIDRWRDANACPPQATQRGAEGVPAPPGGLAYQYTPSQREPDNCVTIYTGLALRGINKLAEATGQEEYAHIAHEACEFLLAMRDPQTHLFYHTTLAGRIIPFPQFVSGAGMTMVGLREAARHLSRPLDLEATEQAILARAYRSGAVQGFIGKELSRAKSHGGVVWEDVAASVNWNAQWFEYLSEVVEPATALAVLPPGSTGVMTRRFLYRDTPTSVRIISWWPWKSCGIHVLRKRSNRAWLSFQPQTIRKWVHHAGLWLRSSWSRGRQDD